MDGGHSLQANANEGYSVHTNVDGGGHSQLINVMGASQKDYSVQALVNEGDHCKPIKMCSYSVQAYVGGGYSVLTYANS